MKIALVHSRLDPGGRTIWRNIDRLLSDNTDQEFPLKRHDLSFHEVEERLIFQDFIDRSLDTDLIFFLSRHASVDPRPVLTTHVTGNIGAAEMGGNPGSVAVAAPSWMHAVLAGLSRHAPPGYRVSYEITHHGPSELSTPSLFVEIGSTINEWEDELAGMAAARSVLEAEPGDVIPVVGIGGTHYARRQTEIALRSRAAFGHIVHTRDTCLLDRQLLSLLAEKSGASAVYIDNKALEPEERARLSRLADESGLLLLGETDLLELAHLSLPAWQAIRELARRIDPAASVSLTETFREGDLRLVSLPEDLVKESLRVDARNLKQGLSSLPVGYLTTPVEPVLPVFISTEEDAPSLQNDLISLCVTLISRGENTSIEGDLLVIRKSRFDPAAARNLGVPEGPLFGELMRGRTVIIDGRPVAPDMVRAIDEKMIRIPGLEKRICDR